jgi:hypothetical protein
MAGQARDILEGIVDIWAYYSYNGQSRVLTILGDDHIGAGHRVKDNFFFTDATRIREVPMGNTAEEAFANFVKAFNNQLQKGGTLVPKRLTVKK